MIIEDKTTEPKYETSSFSKLCCGDTFFVDYEDGCGLYMRVYETDRGNAVKLYSGDFYSFADNCRVILVDSHLTFNKRFVKEL